MRGEGAGKGGGGDRRGGETARAGVASTGGTLRLDDGTSRRERRAVPGSGISRRGGQLYHAEEARTVKRTAGGGGR